MISLQGDSNSHYHRFQGTMTDQLFQQIQALEIGTGKSDLTFNDRLARENGWSPDHTDRVIQEYHRFLYLCARAGHPVTPSDEVDQVWHLHLCYTESYWNDLCRDILEFPLHHGPTKGGKREQDKFRDWYSKTLESYRTAFDEAPPSDIWPDADSRFKPVRFQRINRDTNFVVPKSFLTSPALIGLASLTLLGCVGNFSENQDLINTIIVVAFVVIVLIVLTVKYGGRGGGGSGCGGWGGCGGSCGGGCGGGD